MKIIDFEIKGNQVKFFVGADNCNNYWGDDWNDRPYEHNAGSVYDEFVIGWFIKIFDFDDVVMEPAVGARDGNSIWSKEDMVKKKVPCICILPKKYKDKYTWYSSFDDIISNEKTIKYYFGDKIDETMEDIHYLKKIKDDTLYVRFSFDGDVKIKKLIANMLGESLKIAANDNYIEKFDNSMYEIIGNITIGKYKSYIKDLLKITYKLYNLKELEKALESLKVETVIGRRLGTHNKETYNICCQSNCNFDIGKVYIC